MGGRRERRKSSVGNVPWTRALPQVASLKAEAEAGVQLRPWRQGPSTALTSPCNLDTEPTNKVGG